MTTLTPIVVNERDAAKMLSITVTELWQLVDEGALPRPVWRGRWDVEELRRVVRGDAARYGRLEL